MKDKQNSEWLDISTAPKDGKSMPNAFPDYPDCMLCQDTGVVFGNDQPFRWCACEAAKARQSKEPNAIDRMNVTRTKLGIGQKTA